MKRRILALMLATVMVFGVAACGGAEKEEQGDPVVTEMVTTLQSYAPDLDAAAAAEAGLYTIADGAVAGGQEEWDAFMAEEKDSVIICQFSMKGGAMLDYLRRMEDGSYLLISDISRDGYEYEDKQDYTAQFFTQVKVFGDFVAVEGGTPHTICVMTNDPALDADTFLKYWAEVSYEENGAFLLFVI